MVDFLFSNAGRFYLKTDECVFKKSGATRFLATLYCATTEKAVVVDKK